MLNKPLSRSLIIVALSMVGGPALAEEGPELTSRAPSSHRLAVQAGFSHWYGKTFVSPHGYNSPMIGVSIRPGLRFLDFRGRYAMRVEPIALPDGSESRVGFASLALCATHELRLTDEAVVLYAGIGGLVTHTNAGSLGYGFSMTGGVEYLFARVKAVSIGVFLNIHAISYQLPGEDLRMGDTFSFSNPSAQSARRESQYDLGVVASFF